MKKLYLLLWTIVLLFMLGGCSSTYTVTKGDSIFTVDVNNSTISEGTNIYQYTISGNSYGYYDIKIIYPNGSSYWWEGSSSSGASGWSEGYDQNRYVDGSTLCDILVEREEKIDGSHYGWIILPFLVGGIFLTFFPKKVWYLRYGWHFKEVQPSQLSLEISRAIGIFLMFIAFILLIIRIFQIIKYL
ncbi:MULTISPECIES: hypothetical protein [Clostridiaceae]|uniref:DUF6199 domain-containing protein n=1 Tax=Clostridium facile TaxID=2763035 RepID=A0ABR7IRV2_9CLOT|nr:MULTISPECIES: hypothetical protein [Clostridiaceae]MBC5787866.1 hypothetical protein [Clostridium facile]PWM98610.1 MAG: hypothetical protein DBX37_06395 [Massilioclostridium sp.]